MAALDRVTVWVAGPGGRESRLFTMDSGSAISFLPVSLARRLRLPLIRRSPLRTAGVYVPSVPIVRADIHFRGLRLTLPMAAVPTEMCALGMDVLPRLRYCVV